MLQDGLRCGFWNYGKDVSPDLPLVGRMSHERAIRWEDVEMMGFGTHLMIDGYGGDFDRLQNMDGIFRFLDEYPEKMGMTKIMPPYVFKYVGSKPEDWGLSGVVLIAESHISVHTFPEKGYVSVDLFSCKPFDTDAAVKEVEAVFKLEKMEINSLDRGREFPKDIGLASSLVRQDRLVRFG